MCFFFFISLQFPYRTVDRNPDDYKRASNTRWALEIIRYLYLPIGGVIREYCFAYYVEQPEIRHEQHGKSQREIQNVLALKV